MLWGLGTELSYGPPAYVALKSIPGLLKFKNTVSVYWFYALSVLEAHGKCGERTNKQSLQHTANKVNENIPHYCFTFRGYCTCTLCTIT